MSKLTTIVCTFYQRHKQLYKTLDSFKQYNSEDFNVVIVDDNSPDKIPIQDLESFSFEITLVRLNAKNWICPAPVFNFGFIEALKSNPQNIIIQNAECYHNGNILEYIQNNLTEQNYLTFAAYSLGPEQDVDIKELNNRSAEGNGDSAWYNHSVYRPEALHFCTAITADNLRKINGFDERFATGLGYEDDYLLHQIRILGLKVEIIDNPFVFHQYHYDVKAFTFDVGLYRRTGILCKELKRKKEYRAVHYITADL